MNTLDLGGVSVEVDAEGYMVDPKQWTPEIAALIARQEGIETLTDRHWAVINFCRKESGVPTKELYQLFPKGPGKKVARIAGLPKPTGCI
jgi:sulfur relay (sulfurtransferase) DsrC/TusE family protein